MPPAMSSQLLGGDAVVPVAARVRIPDVVVMPASSVLPPVPYTSWLFSRSMTCLKSHHRQRTGQPIINPFG
jgi:hypothetical protein